MRYTHIPSAGGSGALSDTFCLRAFFASLAGGSWTSFGSSGGGSGALGCGFFMVEILGGGRMVPNFLSLMNAGSNVISSRAPRMNLESSW